MRIELKNLKKSYSDATKSLTVIEGLNFEFSPGKSYAIIGRSGIGKSTLLHLIGGLDRPTSGVVSYDGEAVSSLNDDELTELRGKRVGFIFQFHHLLAEFTALENVAMPLVIAGMDQSAAHAAAKELLISVGLSERLTHRPGELSGGEQQRVSVARALIRKPEVILADEPTGNLDTETGRHIQNLLIELNSTHGSTLVVATHNLELARSLSAICEMQPGGALKAL